MTDSIHKTLLSMRLRVICLGFALRSERPEVQELLQKTRAILLAAQLKAEEAEDYDLAADIDGLQYQIYRMLEDQRTEVSPADRDSFSCGTWRRTPGLRPAGRGPAPLM